jgi:hypothetical protein
MNRRENKLKMNATESYLPIHHHIAPLIDPKTLDQVMTESFVDLSFLTQTKQKIRQKVGDWKV